MRPVDPYPRFPDDPNAVIRKLTDLFRQLALNVNELANEVMARAQHSPAITADTLVKSGKCTYRGYTITTVTATGTIDIRDGTSAGGGVIIDTIPIGTAAGTKSERAVGVICNDGIYADYNGGATGTLNVLFENL